MNNIQKKLDTSTYLKVWNNKPHECEECGKWLEYAVQENVIKDRSVFSHILSKGAFPEHRNNVENFNLLCFEHHQQYEFGNRKSMKIFKNNELIIDKLKRKYNNLKIKFYE